MRQPSERSELFKWYFAALAHGAGGPQAPIQADHPQCGYFRMRHGNRLHGEQVIYLPCYIDVDATKDENGELTGDERHTLFVKYPGNPTVLTRPADEAWTWIADKPVAYESFLQAWETGKWPEEAPGANFRASDTIEGLKDQLETMLINAAQFATIDTQLKCDQAANLKDRIFELGKAATAMKKAELAPIQREGNRIAAKYDGIDSKVKDAVDWLRLMMKPWLTKAEEAAKAAAVAVAGEGAANHVEVKARAGGLAGRRTSLRKKKIAVITDFEACLAFPEVRNSDEVRAGMEKAIDRLVLKAKLAVPGVEVREETSVI